MVGILTPAEEQQERVSTAARVFTRVDRTLSGVPVVCRVVNEPRHDAPAWSTGYEVVFNLAHIGSVTSIEDIISLNGLNYHELSHVLYTPRTGSQLLADIMAADLHKVFNVLEDQRIETLFTGSYIGTRSYFIATFMKYCLSNPKNLDHILPLAWGRRYIPENLRQQFRTMYFNQSVVDELCDLIDEYRMLAYPTSSHRMLAITKRVAELLADNGALSQMDPYGHSERPAQLSSGAPQQGEEQRKAAEKAEDAEEAEEGSGDGQDGNEEGKGKGSGGDGGDDGEEGDGEGSDGKSDKTSGKKGNAHGSSSGGGDDDAPMTSEDIKSLMNDILDQAINDADVQRDAREKQKTIVKGDGLLESSLSPMHNFSKDVPPQWSNIANKVGTEFGRITVDLDPGFRTHQPSGKVNIKRAMQGVDYDTAFDVWEEGKQDASDMEVVVCLDTSLSMADLMTDASLAMWTIKRSIESLGRAARVTIIGFASSTTLLYSADTLAEPTQFRNYSANGGTNPDNAIREARRIFHVSRKKHKVLIMVTDGAWSGGHADPIVRSQYQAKGIENISQADVWMDELGKAGVLTSVVWLCGALKRSSYYAKTFSDPDEFAKVKEGYRHQSKVLTAVESPADLIPFAKALVTEAMRG